MAQSPIKVFLVEDSPIALSILEKLLTAAPDITVVGTARNGIEALEKIPALEPTVICTDLLMGKMDGLELTKQIMTRHPRPILVVSQAVQTSDTDTIFQLLQAGAVDVFPKPKTGLQEDYAQSQQALLHKIRLLSGVKVFKKSTRAAKPAVSVGTVPPLPPRPQRAQDQKILAIGASTGGPQALHKIFSQLPAYFPLPIVCVQHISQGFLDGLVSWLQGSCALNIKVAIAGERPRPGHIYFAPEAHHLGLDKQGRFVYLATPPVNSHRPSVSVTLEAIAQAYGAAATGVLLTGMGRDGADGLLAIAQAGGMTIAQDEASCVIFGMPNEAIKLGAAQQVLDIQAIAPFLLKCLTPEPVSE